MKLVLTDNAPPQPAAGHRLPNSTALYYFQSHTLKSPIQRSAFQHNEIQNWSTARNLPLTDGFITAMLSVLNLEDLEADGHDNHLDQLFTPLSQLYAAKYSAPEKDGDWDALIDRITPLIEGIPTDHVETAKELANLFLGIHTLDLDTIPSMQLDEETHIWTRQIDPESNKTMMNLYERLSPGQAAQVTQCIGRLLEFCQPDGIKSVLEGALKNVKQPRSLLDLPGEDRPTAMIVSRITLMTDYIAETGREVGNQYWISSTGSDPHAGGRHALFLIHKETGAKSVYKPHSLVFEDSFMGRNGLISQINETVDLPEGMTLPTMGIETPRHMEEFADRTGDSSHPIEEQQIKYHMAQLGMLEVISKVCGVTDLHAENVIFTDRGPIPVDAECALWYGETMIEDGLFGVAQFPERITLNSSALYRPRHEDEPGPVQVKRSDYQEDYNVGKEDMKRAILAAKKSVIHQYGLGLAPVDKIRMVLITTGQLSLDIESYAQSRFPESEYEKRFNTSLKNLNSSNWAFNKVFPKSSMNERAFRMIYEESLAQGILPAFELCLKPEGDITAGTVLMNGRPVGRVPFDSEEKLKKRLVQRMESEIEKYCRS